MVVSPRLAIVASHPIQYQTPLFRALSEVVDLRVFFAHRQLPEHQADAGFAVPFEWDVDLFDGYEHTFLTNRARRPGTDSYAGCDTPDLGMQLASGKFDAALTMGWYLKSYTQAFVACKRLGMRVMVRGDSTLIRKRSVATQAVKRILFPIMFRKIDAFLVVGRKSKSYLEHFGVTEDRMFWSPHSVDNNWFATAARAAEGSIAATRMSLGCQSGELIVLFVGKFIPCKRPLDLVRALTVLRADGVPVRGVFVGHGELYEEIAAVGRTTNAPISLVGFKNQSELPAIYAAADVLVVSSGQETWGLVVNEAMACGTPAIVSDVVGCAEDLIEAGKTGFQYPVGNIEILVREIKKLLPISKCDDVKHSLNRKMSEYSLERAIDGIVDAIRHGYTY